MPTRNESRSLTQIVKATFLQVAKSPQLKNKWIELESWFRVVRESNMQNELVRRLTPKHFTTIISKEFFVSENNSINSYGVYMMRKQLRNGRGGEEVGNLRI